MSRTFGLLKPDCLKRGLSSRVIEIIQSSGLWVVRIKKLTLTEDQVRIIWRNCIKEDYFPKMLEFSMSGESYVFLVEGVFAIRVLNAIVGHCDPELAAPGTIRHNYGISKIRNIIHSSKDYESYVEESSLFF